MDEGGADQGNSRGGVVNPREKRLVEWDLRGRWEAEISVSLIFYITDHKCLRCVEHMSWNELVHEPATHSWQEGRRLAIEKSDIHS
jgi:hypothetical protein